MRFDGQRLTVVCSIVASHPDPSLLVLLLVVLVLPLVSSFEVTR
jgi:hypothetical protein